MSEVEMIKKFTVTAVTSLAMLASPAPEAQAGNALAAGIAGAIIGGAIVSAAQKNKRRKTYVRTRVTSPQRQENRDVQTALNYFSFPAGTPDGVFGRKTRTAVSSYQLFMSYPITGHLTEYQKTILLTSYQRSIAGGVAVAQIVASSPNGTREMLKNTQQQMAGGATVIATAPQVIVQPQAVVVQPAQQFATQPQAQTASAQSGGAFQMPSFGSETESGSIANHCNKVSLLTNTNGGFTNVSNMQDPVFALNEQFCLARSYAIAKSEEMITKVRGVTSAQMQAQCETLGPAFKEQVSLLSLGNRDKVIAKTSEMILSTGMSPAQLTHTAKICLGVGYRTDNADVALASTLILVTLGEPVYGELLGHHLVNGFGTSQRKDLAVQWYASANNAIEMGMPAVFVPGQTNRPALIKAAVAQLNSPAPMTPTAAAAPVPQSTGFVVPTFDASSN